MSEDGFTITGSDNIETARWLAVRSALSLEIRGLRRSGRSARVLANEITGQNHRITRKAYEALNGLIVDTLGESFNRPLYRDRLTDKINREIDHPTETWSEYFNGLRHSQ